MSIDCIRAWAWGDLTRAACSVLASKDRKRLGRVIWTAFVPELARIERTETQITLGAAVTYTATLPLFDELYPSFAQLIR